jgi:MFS family permease
MSNRNFRVYTIGQLASMAGTFMQTVAQGWLVLRLTGSGTALGIVTTLQFLPPLVLGFPFGVLADRVDRRRLFLVTEVIAAALAATLGFVTATGAVKLWMVMVIAFLTGVMIALETPVRHSFVFDMVGPAEAPNAISLSMAMVNTSRVLGPALAGLTIAVFDIAPCFFINALSFVAVVVSLLMVRPSELHPVPAQEHKKGLLREGWRYLVSTPELLATFVLCCMFFAFAWEFEIVFPLVAKYTFGSGAGVYGVMQSVIGVGAVVAATVNAGARPPGQRVVAYAVFVVAGAYFVAAIAPNLLIEMLALPFVGAGAISVAWVINTRLQLGADDRMRGRVMAMWTIGSMGSRPIGAPIVGWVGQHVDPRAAVALGAIGPLVGLALWWLIQRRDVPAPVVPVPEVAVAPEL